MKRKKLIVSGSMILLKKIKGSRFSGASVEKVSILRNMIMMIAIVKKLQIVLVPVNLITL